ncbi:ABC transporter ATP-binding protein [Ensifer adhaerens]|uniref:ABC transporter ATP-binding protein n=1 Tax=Ensifer adhaerens TaxID=106592 RepID=UPI0023A99B9D|nr:ABC transporter ATP-binding protein [Ensifer adhaerens]WDZ76226.1 ABC transporter ATP-binding protein [Ensifer adhaerens]
MVDLVVDKLIRRYGTLQAIDNVSFTVKSGEFLTLLGPSGCGKSTTLGALAGLDKPTEGLIKFGDRTIFDSAKNIYVSAEARNCGLVFQSYALWPHMTIEQNLAFPLKLRKVERVERDRRIREVLSLVEMQDYAKRYPNQLSGGQQQRVALARTLVYQPSILLLDEPLSNLDAKLRDKARLWLSELQAQVRLTTIYVTHDQSEALALSDRIAVMNKGRIVQLGTPHEIYSRPADPFVADFIGTSTFFPGRVQLVENDSAVVALPGGKTLVARSVKPLKVGVEVVAAVRPEHLILSTRGENRPGELGTMLEGRIVSRSYLGAQYQYLVEIDGVTAKTESAQEFPADTNVGVWVPANGAVVFAKDS